MLTRRWRQVIKGLAKNKSGDLLVALRGKSEYHQSHEDNKYVYGIVFNPLKWQK